MQIQKLACPQSPEVHLARHEDITPLIRLVRRSDERAFTQLIRLYEPGLRRTAKRVLGPMIQAEVDTEDLIQFVHGCLWTSLRQGKFEIDSPERLLAVARSLLRRRVARIWRNMERRRRLKVNIPVDGYCRSELAVSVESMSQISAEDQFQHLCKMITRTERRLIELRFLGYSTAEAAREMGREPESLRVTLARLRRKLRTSGIMSETSEPG